MRTCIEMGGYGLPIKLEQREDSKALFRVTYGLQVHDHLTYAEGMTEFGKCVFHALACEGLLNNEGD